MTASHARSQLRHRPACNQSTYCTEGFSRGQCHENLTRASLSRLTGVTVKAAGSHVSQTIGLNFCLAPAESGLCCASLFRRRLASNVVINKEFTLSLSDG